MIHMILPMVIIRVAPIKFSEIERLTIPQDRRVAVKRMFDERIKIKAQINEFIIEANKIIGITTDSSTRKVLLNTKRKFLNDYHENNLTTCSYVQYEPLGVTPELIQNLIALTYDHTLMVDSLKYDFNSTREIVNDLISQHNFQNGILLSSKALLGSINKLYRNALRPKESIKTEVSILKYISRIIAKTSPFSTFTHVDVIPVGENRDNSENNAIEFIKKTPQTSYVRLNNNLLKLFLEMLLEYPNFYKKLYIRVNPTIQPDNAKVSFLFSSHNTDIFQNIENNVILHTILTLLHNNKEGIVFEELNAIIRSLPTIEADKTSVNSYIKQLINYGLLEYKLNISGIDPYWDITLWNVLEVVKGDDSILNKMTVGLKNLRNKIVLYEHSNVEDRQINIQDSYVILLEMYYLLHEALELPLGEREVVRQFSVGNVDAFKKWQETINKEARTKEEMQVGSTSIKHKSNSLFTLSAEQIIYEDVRANIIGLVTQNQLIPIIRSITLLINSLREPNQTSSTLNDLDNYFIEHVGKEHKLPLLLFYKKFYEHLREKQEAEKHKNNESKKEEAIKKTEGNYSRVEKDVLKKNIEFEEQFQINKAVKNSLQNNESIIEIEMPTINDDMKVSNDQSLTSKTAILQLFNIHSEKDSTPYYKGVLNGLTPGYGKMFSRFLHMFDISVTDEIIRNNLKLQGENLFIENKDGSYFNANIHPTLLNYELWTPGAHNTLPHNQQISVTDLEVYFDETDNKLRIRDVVSNQKVKIIDLGFQGSMGRSEFFKFIDAICTDEFTSFQPLLKIINGRFQAELDSSNKLQDVPLIYPRIQYNSNLIIQRKGWLFQSATLPKFGRAETEEAYFLKVNEWKMKHKLPDAVFIKLIHPYFTPEAVDGESTPQKSNLRRDDYKPQYINFLNPLLTNLLADMLKRAHTTVYFEEMLPSSEQLLKINGEGHVTEFFVQFDS